MPSDIILHTNIIMMLFLKLNNKDECCKKGFEVVTFKEGTLVRCTGSKSQFNGLSKNNNFECGGT